MHVALPNQNLGSHQLSLLSPNGRPTLEAFGHEWIYRGHEMPSVVQTDKRANIECQTIREICQRIGSTEDTQHHPIHSVAGETSNKMYASRLTPFQRIMIRITHGSKLPYDRIEKRN